MTANDVSRNLDDGGLQSLRMNSSVWTVIDTSRLRSIGGIAHNIWITEAIAEKLAHKRNNDVPRALARVGHV